MPSRIALTLAAVAVGALFLLAACQNPGPTTVAQPEPLQPLGVIVPITGQGDEFVGGPGAAPSAFITTCGICHTVDSAGTAGVIGPDLSNIATVAANRRGGMSAEAYIRESIEDPAAFIAPDYNPLMTAGLKDVLGVEYEEVVAYLLTLE